MSTEFTAEQLAAIERRHGDLLLDASAGAGKTSVLVERFVAAVRDDGIEVSAILAITFTEKAAAELRDRIRKRLRELGEDEAARATEGAFIATIHGFCARVLRANALAAGIDPAFEVLDEAQCGGLAQEAFHATLADLAEHAPGGVELIASYGAAPLRGAILATHGQLRSRGHSAPALPTAAPAPELTGSRLVLEQAAASLAAELGSLGPAPKVEQALERLQRCPELIAAPDPWPGDLDGLCLPGGNCNALCTPACESYREALLGFRRACEQRLAARALALLDRLLRGYSERYAERKRARSGLDFEDLELMTRDLLALDGELRARLRARFDQIMVDELQDTNPVQLELIESIARQNLFMVGDALQSIYGFRHADVSLFERRREVLAASGAHASLATNFRSRREILAALNLAFAAALGEGFTPLAPGRLDAPVPDPRVELLIADKGADWAQDGLAAAWRTAEARALAGRVSELIEAGAAARDVVLLTRATTDLRAYERALEDLGIPTYVIGGRGYWSHPQVVDLVAYLRALANPRDEEALYTVLASPLVGVSVDALVLLAAHARRSGRDPWWVLRAPDDGPLDELASRDRELLVQFADWFAVQRRESAHAGIEDLIDLAVQRTGYDLAMLALPGGERRLANIRKLMRLGREHEASGGGDLRGFLELVRARSAATGSEPRESEAPVEGEALDAVRLMTIHRAKGLEFPIVCVADLGRGPRWRGELLRVGSDGRVGLQIARPGTGKRETALHYEALGDEAAQAEASEERRLFYVAMTRAQERLILSGAARLDPWTAGRGGTPIAWIAPAFVPDLGERLERGEDSGVAERSEGEWAARIGYTVVRPEKADGAPEPGLGATASTDRVRPEPVAAEPATPEPAVPEPAVPEPAVPEPVPAADAPPPVSSLSYSSLGEYARCAYRFYLERVLTLPRGREPRPPSRSGMAAGARRLSGTERGVLIHALLEGLDFGRPARPAPDSVAGVAARAGLTPSDAETAELQALVEGFGASDLCSRIARAADVRREERFAFLLEPGGVPVTGVLDVAAREGDRLLVVDYKSDALGGEDPATHVQREYAIQRLVYALAALASGVRAVEVAHVFLELPEQPVSARFHQSQRPGLARQLAAVASGVLDRNFGVSDAPRREVCAGCPGEGGLCSWPLEMTRREAADRLF